MGATFLSKTIFDGRNAFNQKVCGCWLLSSFLMCMVLFLLSCKHDVGDTMLIQKENLIEKEKVLAYFNGGSDTLKYESARFLLENMPYHFTYGYNNAEKESIYVHTTGEPLNLRYSYYKKRLDSISEGFSQNVVDEATFKADYLIEMINRACDNWNQTKWNKYYDKTIFFDYVLPYRLNSEPLSNWLRTIDVEFPLLKAPVVLSRRGLQYEAEDAILDCCTSIETEGASAKRAILMCKKQSTASFKIQSERATQKRLVIKYTTNSRGLHAILKVNGIIIDTLQFVPTRNLKSFGEKWFNFSLPLRSGHNTLTICDVTDTLGVDYIQLGAIEQFATNQLVDFSTACCQLMNKQSHNFITLDTLQNQIELRPFIAGDCNQLFRMNYQGYPLWKVSAFHNEYRDYCLEVKFGTPGTLSPDSIVTKGIYDNRPFQQWVFFPVGKDCYRIMNKHTGLFLESKTNLKQKKELLVQNSYSNSDSQIWILHRGEKNTLIKTFPIGCTIHFGLKTS